jgi:hypothetical protein
MLIYTIGEFDEKFGKSPENYLKIYLNSFGKYNSGTSYMELKVYDSLKLSFKDF